MLALVGYERGVCECGFHESLTGDLSNHFTFDVKVCSVCKGAAQHGRVQADADERALKAMGENPPPSAPRESDGRRTFTRMMSTAEVERLRASRAREQARRQPEQPHR